MSLPNPGMNFTAFDPLTAAELNQMVANITALAAGTGLDLNSILYNRLPIPPACSLNRLTDTTASSGSSVLVPFDNELYDTASLHSTTTNTSRITIPAGYAGLWLVTGTIKFTGGVAGSRFAGLWKNGMVWKLNRHTFGTTNGDVSAMITEVMSLAVADYVELLAYTDGGGTTTIQGGTPPDQDHTSFQAVYLGRLT